MPPQDYPPADHIQQISETTYNEARAYGYSADDMTLLPCGVFPDRFRVDSTREQLRERNGISPGTTVVLSVAALNRYHKRTDYLIREVAETEGDLLLWLDGSLDHGDPDLIAEAETKLGDRCRITHVPTDSVGELYAMADLMVHTATFEAFGLAIVEGAMMGLPLLIHNGAHFRWLVPNEASWVDMNQPGALAERLAGLMENRSNLASLTGEESARARFEWAGLKGKYASLYDRLMERDDDVRVPAIDS